MKAYELTSGKGVDSLRMVDRAEGPLGPHEVRVKLAAAALNYRDVMIAEGTYYSAGEVVVPLSDGVGRVVETGSAVTRVKNGDRVILGFWPDWLDGPITPGKVARSFGAQLAGTLAEAVVADEHALVIAPDSLSDREAATVACAGLTAWNALFARGALKPGATVLLLGTGGVSLWALQLALAARLRPIIISSSDEKLARAKKMGAVATINYSATPEWQQEVRRLTDGVGVDLVIEVGGQGTMRRSVEATRMGGAVVVVGARAGAAGDGVEPGALIGGAKTLAGIMVGSRAMLEDLVRFIDVAGVRPVIDSSFAFEQAGDAFRRVQAGAFGKVVIDITQ
ncbi:NAD(P)-dependent alcohol dehydrogenase [Oxalobacteraceae bacterium OTU3CINTB1]|nr:NAD(P)-dependent alcohol dehydrogenase [Oxalobacteraceae bacterium OTU3CINTB1]